MGRHTARLYVPLDASFFDDDKVLEAGERAGWLYLNMLCKAKATDADGVFTKPQIAKLGVPGWKPRLDALLRTELVVELPQSPGSYAIAAWLNWNEARADRETRRAEDRRRKAEEAAARKKGKTDG